MNKVVPWFLLCEQIDPFYPEAINGRPPLGQKRMLRICFLQHWFNLSDPGAEEALYKSRSVCRFAGIDRGGPWSLDSDEECFSVSCEDNCN